MTLLEMIKEWRKGCTDAANPVCCHECTNGLIDAMERKLSASDFNYPECLDRIVDAGMKAAEAKILEFKKMDEHDEMMSRMNTPDDFRFNCSGGIISGPGGGQGQLGGDGGAYDLHPGDSRQAIPKWLDVYRKAYNEQDTY